MPTDPQDTSTITGVLDQCRRNLASASAASVTIQGSPEDSRYVRALESVAEDAARLIRALGAVETMACQLQARGEHDMIFSKSIQDENIADTIHTSGAGMVENARRIRYAISRGLESSAAPVAGVGS